MTDNYAIVGAGGPGDANKAFIFAISNGVWGTTAVATIDGYTSEKYFGGSVAMTDNYAIVGAWGAGKAFIFAINNGVWNTTAVATIDGYTSEYYFGISVAMTDNYAIVGGGNGRASAPWKAFIFAISNGVWNTTAVATIDGYTSTFDFGYAVAMTDNYAIVGADQASKAFIFANNNGVWNTTAVAAFDDSDRSGGFGGSVAMTDNYAIVGASGAQKAFIFAINNGVWNTTAVATIDGYNRTEFGFGSAVAMTDNYAIVGAGGDNSAQKAFIFANSNGVWGTTAFATIDGYTSGFDFGWSVAMTDNYAIVGAQQNAFIFANTQPTTETTTTTETLRRQLPKPLE
eukprot:g5249.t1